MGTWIAGLAVFAAVFLATHKLVKDRKAGKCCGCDGCAGQNNTGCCGTKRQPSPQRELL